MGIDRIHTFCRACLVIADSSSVDTKVKSVEKEEERAGCLYRLRGHAILYIPSANRSHF